MEYTKSFLFIFYSMISHQLYTTFLGLTFYKVIYNTASITSRFFCFLFFNFYFASDPRVALLFFNLTSGWAIRTGYPWICSLHIQLNVELSPGCCVGTLVTTMSLGVFVVLVTLLSLTESKHKDLYTFKVVNSRGKLVSLEKYRGSVSLGSNR